MLEVTAHSSEMPMTKALVLPRLAMVKGMEGFRSLTPVRLISFGTTKMRARSVAMKELV